MLNFADGGGRAAEWVRRRERGSLVLLKVMAFLSLRLGRRLSRIILYGIAVYFFLFAPSARRHSQHYLRLALRRRPTIRDRFLHILSFATTIHDRVYLINDRDDLFNITVEGDANVLARVAGGRGALLMGAHIGSFEVIRCLSRHQHGIHVAMAMYEENARKISGILAAINPACVPDIVSLGQIDAMLNIAERLEHGGFVGVLGDRTLAASPCRQSPCWARRPTCPPGRCARPPFCAVRCSSWPACTAARITTMWCSNRSRISRQIQAEAARRPCARPSSAMPRVLDRYCRSDPYNWFNFFDFWRRPAATPERVMCAFWRSFSCSAPCAAGCRVRQRRRWRSQ